MPTIYDFFQKMPDSMGKRFLSLRAYLLAGSLQSIGNKALATTEPYKTSTRATFISYGQKADGNEVKEGNILRPHRKKNRGKPFLSSPEKISSGMKFG